MATDQNTTTPENSNIDFRDQFNVLPHMIQVGRPAADGCARDAMRFSTP